MQANFTKILEQFQQQGYTQDSYLRVSDIERVLDGCAKKNANLQKFNRQIAKQLWENTLKNDEGDCVMLKDYIETICEAQQILKEKIKRFQDKYSAEINQQKKKEYMVNMYTLSQDEKLITAPFKVNEQSPSQFIKLSKYSINISDKTSNSIFDDSINLESKLSLGLTIVAYLGFISFLLELIMMLNKMNFYGLLTMLLVISIFILNYFDRVYIQLVFLNLVLSVVLDSVWLAMQFQKYQSPLIQTWNLALQPIFLKFIIITTFVVFAFKIVMAAIIFKYRGNPHGLRKKANFLMLSFSLDANPVRNAITPTVRKTFPKFLIG